MPIAAMPWLAHGSVSTPGTLAISGVSASVAEATSVTAGVVVAVVGLAGLGLGILRANRERARQIEQARKDYEHEIEAAERRGENRYRWQSQFWQATAVAHLMSLGLPIPTPPSHEEEGE